MNDDLTFLETLFRKIAEDQRRLATEWSSGPGAGVGVDFVRGHAAAFDKAADIVAERIALAAVGDADVEDSPSHTEDEFEAREQARAAGLEPVDRDGWPWES
jgi:hypothetical protein